MAIVPIDSMQSGFMNVGLKNLTNSIFCIGLIPPFSGVKQVNLGFFYGIGSFADDALLLERAFDFIG